MKKNKVFKFLSSVKLAIPLMFAMTAAVAYGTIVESRYNTDMARLVVYHTIWFQILLVLLWVNIFCATLSRIPFQKHHVGFIITHIGLLTVLIGSLITSIWGIDGQLQIPEKTQSNEVLLPELVLGIINKDNSQAELYEIPRSLKEKNYDDFKSINDNSADRVSILGYMPFAQTVRSFKALGSVSNGNVAVSFRLKSAFFDVSEWLQSQQNPEIQMGPAHLSLILHSGVEKGLSHKGKKREPSGEGSSQTEEALVVLDQKGDAVKTIPLSILRQQPVTLGAIKISLAKVYEQAMVGENNKISEGGKTGMNPALEINVTQGEKSLREVAYAKFPDFSLNPKGAFGLKFKYVGKAVIAPGGVASADAGAPGEPMAHAAPGPVPAGAPVPQDDIHAKFRGPGAPMGAGGNEVQFHVYAGDKEKLELKLLKGGVQVLSQWVKPGEAIQTPWMGMELTLNDLVFNGTETSEVKPVEQGLRTEMPPSALLIKPAGAGVEAAVWLIEGDVRDLTLNGKNYQVYYGRKTFRLPFNLYLDTFTKKDYPGTETPMSFESLTQVNHEGAFINIHMNEPLVKSGYTLYQASYILNPGQPAISIFSVNWDPGRWIKYIGSLILVTGIITFTLMRSRVAKPKREVSA